MVSKSVFDTQNLHDWSERLTVFDAQGFRLSQTTTFDDGRIEVRSFEGNVLAQIVWSDPNDAAAWDSRTLTFDTETGAILSRKIEMDDGRLSETTFVDGIRTERTIEDLNEVYDWTRKAFSYEAGTGKLASVNTKFDDDTEEVQLSFEGPSNDETVRVDVDGKFKWHTLTTAYDARGDITQRTDVYDDGATRVTEFTDGIRTTARWSDDSDARSWSSLAFDYDSAGRLKSATRVEDDGRQAETDYVDGIRSLNTVTDVEDAYRWLTKTIQFDAFGRKSTQVIVYDDGRQATTTFDDGVIQSRTILDLNNAYRWDEVTRVFNGPDAAEVFTNRVADDGTVKLTDARQLDVIIGGTGGTVVEDAAPLLQASGQIETVAGYIGSTEFVAVADQIGSAGLGQFTLAADGSWTYRADTAQRDIQALGTGDSLTDSLTVMTTDGLTTTITVTIEGTDDGPAPVYIGGDVIAFGEAGNLATAALPIDLSQLFADENGDPIMVAATGLPARYDLVGNMLSFANPGDVASDATAGDTAITLTATDGTGESTTVNVTLTTALARTYTDGMLSGFSGITYTSGDDRLQFGAGAGENGFLALSLGAGDDAVQFGAFAADDGELRITAGDGDDTVVFADDAARSTDGFGLGDIDVDLGAGDDVLTVGARAGVGGLGITVQGGAGRDVITLGDSANNILIDLGSDDDADEIDFAGSMSNVTIRNWVHGDDTITLSGLAGLWTASDVAGDLRFDRVDGSFFTIEGAAGVAPSDVLAEASLNAAPVYSGGTDRVAIGSVGTGATASLSFDLSTLFTDPDTGLGDALTVTLDTVPNGFGFANNTLTPVDATDLALMGDYTVRATATDLSGVSVTQDIPIRVTADISYASLLVSSPAAFVGTDGDDVVTIPDATTNAAGDGQFTYVIQTRAGDDTIVIGNDNDQIAALNITDPEGDTSLVIGDAFGADGVTADIDLSTAAGAAADVVIGDDFAGRSADITIVGRGSFTFGDDAANTSGRLQLDVAGDVEFGDRAGVGGAVFLRSLDQTDMTFGTGAENLNIEFAAPVPTAVPGDGSAETVTFEGSVKSATLSNFQAGIDTLVFTDPDTDWSAFDVGGDKYFLDARGSSFTIVGAAGIAADTLAPRLVAAGKDAAHAPFKAILDTFTIGEESVLNGTLLDNDILLGAPVTVSLIDQGTADGSLVVNADGSFGYTSDRDDLWQGYKDTVHFIYGITDTNGLTAQAMAEVTIEGENDTPLMADATFNVAEGVRGTGQNGEYVLDLSGLGRDPDGDDNGQTLTYSITGGTFTGFATIDGTDLNYDASAGWTYLDGGQSLTHELEITATDRHGASSTGTITVEVAGTDQMIAGVYTGYVILEDESTLFDVLDGVFPIDEGDTLSVTEVIGAQYGSAVMEDGQIRYTPFPDFWGQDQVIFKVQDSDGFEAFGRANVRVEQQADAPLLSFQTVNGFNRWDVGLIVRAETTDFEGDPENNNVAIDRFELTARDANGDLVEDFENYVNFTEYDLPLFRTDGAFTFYFDLPDGAETEWDIEVKAVAQHIDGSEASSSEVYSIAFDQTVNQSIQTFDIESQSIWNSGASERFTASETFGGSFDEAGGAFVNLAQFDHRAAGVGVSTDFSIRMDGKANGSVGVTASTGIEGGTVTGTAAYSVFVDTSLKTTSDATLLEFKTRAVADPGAGSFDASSPTLDFDLALTDLDLYADFAARLWGYLHFHLGTTTIKPIDRGNFYDGWGFDAVVPLDASPFLGSDGLSIVNYDGVDTVQFMEFGPSTQDLNGSYVDGLGNKLLDYALGTASLSNTATGAQGSLLSGESSDVFANLTLDLDSIAASILGKKNPLGQVKNESQGPFSYGFEYDLVDFDLVLEAAYRQANSLDLSTLDGTILFEDGSEVDFVFGSRFALANADQYDLNGDNDGQIEYDILMRPTAQFNSDGYLDLSIYDQLKVLGASVTGGLNAGDFYGVSTPGFSVNKSVGPVYSNSGLLIDESSSITLAQRSFELDVEESTWDNFSI